MASCTSNLIFEIMESCIRTGKISIRNKLSLNTPNFLFPVNGGSYSWIPTDLFQINDIAPPKAVSYTFSNYCTYPGSVALSSQNRSLTTYCSLYQNSISLLLLGDNNLNLINSKSNLSVNTPNGRKIVDPQDYCQFAKLAKCDIVESLSERINDKCSYKRAEKNKQKNIELLTNMIDYSDNLFNIFARIEVCIDVIDRSLLLTTFFSSQPVTGFAINGLNDESVLKDSDSVDAFRNLLHSITSLLPANKPRLIHNIGHPKAVIIAVENGIDIFDGSILQQLADSNLIFNMPLKILVPAQELIFDLSDPTNADKMNSLTEGCECYTCKHYTRAYVNHLISTKELLSNTLIMIHNYWQYTMFFTSIRNSLANGDFELIKKIYL